MSGGTVLNPRHADRPVVRVAVDGQPRIQKRHRSDSRSVYDAMVALWASPFGAGRPCPGLPEPLSHRHDTDADSDGGVIEMVEIGGAPLSTRGAWSAMRESLDDVALLLADLHRSGVVVGRHRGPQKVMRLLGARLDDTDRGLVEHLARRAPEGESMCLNHGDFSPRNVLLTASGPTLIDFDRLQMAGPGRDLNHLGAWCWTMTALGRDTSGHDAWERCDEFEAAYLAHRPAAAADVVGGRAFHRATGLLRIATEWSIVTTDAAALRMVLDEAWRIASRPT